MTESLLYPLLAAGVFVVVKQTPQLVRRLRMSGRLKRVQAFAFEKHYGAALKAQNPHWSAQQHAQAWRGVRQYFYACVLEHTQNGTVQLDMPSSIADEAWHVMLKDEQGYQRWCKEVLGFELTHVEKKKRSYEVELFKRDPTRLSDGVYRLWAVLERNKHRRVEDRKILEYWHGVPLIFALDASMGGMWEYSPQHIEALKNPPETKGAGGGGSCGGSSGQSECKNSDLGGSDGDCGSSCGGSCGGD